MTNSTEKLRGKPLPPQPAAMIEALRDIGYSLEAAIADILDNSITAHAKAIHIRFGWESDNPWLAVIDDGDGMSEEDLTEAMRPGSRNPRDARKQDDLGRFSLGLKTASFSQCRRLTVVSRKSRLSAARRWDLDVVADENEWFLLHLDAHEISELPIVAELPSTGTYVLWQELDRLDLGARGDAAHAAFNERIASIRRHVALVFHRFMAPEPGFKRVRIFINHNEIEPFEPFNAKNPATDHLYEEKVAVGSDEVRIQAYVLPHHTKVPPAEYEKYAGEEGYLRSQGFYVYRNRRLIRHGTWFRLCKQEEITKLARVQIDIPNSLDHLWTIDVRKSRANPPEIVRSRMRQVVERIRGAAKRPYTHRGDAIHTRSSEPVWVRKALNDRIAYEVNAEHALVENLRLDMDEALRGRFDTVLRMIAASLPYPALFSDMGSQPRKVEPNEPDEELLTELVKMMREANPGISAMELKKLLLRTEPFATWKGVLDRLIPEPDGG